MTRPPVDYRVRVRVVVGIVVSAFWLCCGERASAFLSTVHPRPSSSRPNGFSSAIPGQHRNSNLRAASTDGPGPLPLDANLMFHEMQGLDSRLGILEASAPDDLGNFYEPHLKSFSVKPGSASRLSITSTCYSLMAILSAADPKLFDSIVVNDLSDRAVQDEHDRRLPLREAIAALLSAEWREDDMFQVPLLLHTVLSADPNRAVLGNTDEKLASQVRRLVASVLAARPRRRYGPSQRFSEYINFQCCRALAELHSTTPIPDQPIETSGAFDDEDDHDDDDDHDEDHNPDFVSDFGQEQTAVGGLALSAIPEGTPSRIVLALERFSEFSFNELCRQLALRSSGDTTSFDVMRLAYSLLAYVISTDSLSGSAGREIFPGRGPSTGTNIARANQRVVRNAIAAFFDEQLGDGLWEKGQPIYKAFRRQGREIGNAFVYSVDTLGSLLENLPFEYFRPHLGRLERTLAWIESHRLVEIIPDYCDAETGQCFGKQLNGWNSPHITTETAPQAWSTAQTLTFLMRMRHTIRKLMHADVLKEFGGSFLSHRGVTTEAWDRLLDSDLGDPKDERGGEERTLTIKHVLEERVINPFSLSVASSPSFGAAYSAILFGPPGTAKTTICESLAQRMGWDFVVIDTAVFLADGLTNVASRIRYVFERLRALNRCVILFDEIEEFCLDRETPGLGMESRMLTTAMLTAINDLRRAKRSVFFLATNRLRAFDSAVIRPGRFDMQLFVGTPNLGARVVQFRQKLASIPASIEEKENAVEKYRDFLDSVWSQDAMFMNFLEGMQFASTCASLVANGNELSHEEMQIALSKQASVMTVRGAVRDEYIASMVLSRL